MRNATVLVTIVTFAIVLVMRDSGHLTRRTQFASLWRRKTSDSDVGLRIVSSVDDSISSNTDDFCSLVHSKLTHTPSNWWTTHFLDIIAASQQAQDPNYIYKNWTMSLLASLTPEMLRKASRNHPSAHSLGQILDVVHKRILDPASSPPLKIAVVGGSVTRGEGCQTTVMPGAEKLYPATCAWPARLERLINTLAGFQLVQVFNLAVSATKLSFGTPLVKYWLYPEDLLPQGPDVIIASYSTNEQGGPFDSTRFAEEKRARVDDFLSAVNNARPCQPPLVIFVDDYLGSLRDNILGEMAYNKIVTELAEWYGNVWHVSYADVLRRAIYANTNETTFTWPPVHFGMAGHMTIAWTALYAVVEAISGYCDNQAFLKKMEQEGREGVFPMSVLNLMNTVQPPKLRPELLLSTVTSEWQEMAVRARESRSNCKGETLDKIPCTFAFLAGPDATVKTPEQLKNYLLPFLVENKGWNPTMEHGAGGQVEKLGLLAGGANASMTLRMTNLTKEVRTINLQAIKSYGDKWVGSLVRLTVTVEKNGNMHSTQFDMQGFHNIKTSVSHPFEYDLKENKAETGSDITLSIDLVGGTTFKILGMMLCDG